MLERHLIGSNHTITNRILCLDMAKPFKVLERGLESGVKKMGRLEPKKSLSKRTESAPFGDGFCAQLSLVDDVRTAAWECLKNGHFLTNAE